MIIAINGSLGSGKSTVAKMLAQNLGFQYLSSGAWFRELAAERGLNVVELSHAAERDQTIDQTIDDRLKALNNSSENIIIDSRMAPVFIDNAIKIRLVVSDDEGARRILNDKARGKVESFTTQEEAKINYRLRAQSEKDRYFELYGVDLEDESYYNLILDTSNCSPIEIEATIEDFIKNFQ